MATKAGETLYRVKGYRVTEEVLYKSQSGLMVPMMKMEKRI
jgi:hypothetical protein